MMSRVRTSILPVLALLTVVIAAPAAKAEDATSVQTTTAIYLATAEVTRADVADGRLTLRTQGRTVVMETDSESPSIRGLRPGAAVVVGYRALRGVTGGERHMLVALRQNTPGLTPRPASTMTTTVVPARLAQADPPAGSAVRLVSVRSARSNWPAASWTTTTMAPPPPPPASGGIPLTYIIDGIPSVPIPTPAPRIALPPATVADDGDVGRVEAERDLEAGAAQLALAADTLDRAWAGHREICINAPMTPTTRSREWFRLLDGGMPAPDRDNCRTQRQELTQTAQRFRDQLQAAVDSARGADVLPGRIREVLGRHRIDI